jgi:hypothetical protein
MNKIFTRNITSYDILKTFAVVTMIIDHIGFYFFPDQISWRAVGRLSAPVWFFLIGYAQSRDVPKIFWIGAVAITVSRMVSGFYFFPLNTLVTLALCRLLIDRVMTMTLRSYQSMIAVFIVLFFLALPTQVFFEYGTLGLMFAMLGYMVRNRAAINMNVFSFYAFFAGVIISYLFLQIIVFPFTENELKFFTGAMMVVAGAFLIFAPAEYPKMTGALGPIGAVIRFMGRYSLEIYVVHLVILGLVAMWFDPVRFVAFDFKWLPPEAAELFLPGQG